MKLLSMESVVFDESTGEHGWVLSNRGLGWLLNSFYKLCAKLRFGFGLKIIARIFASVE